MTGLIVFLCCLIFMLGLALPLLKPTPIPEPPPGGWKKFDDDEDEDSSTF